MIFQETVRRFFEWDETNGCPSKIGKWSESRRMQKGEELRSLLENVFTSL